MKIEKLTDNKIRIVINSYELEKNNINISKLTKLSIEKQTFFFFFLKKKKKEVVFIIGESWILKEKYRETAIWSHIGVPLMLIIGN